MSGAHTLACQQLVELVTAYLDDALTPADHGRVQEHLTACGDCAAYLTQMRTLTALAAQTSEADADAALPPGMLSNLLKEYRRRTLP